MQRSCTSGYLCSVAADEVVHGLLLGELADRWKHAKGITAQQYEILGMGTHTRNPGIVDVVDGVRSTRVLCHSTAVHQVSCE